MLSHSLIGASISDRSIELVELRRAGKSGFEIRSSVQRPLESGIVEGGKILDGERLGAAMRETSRLAVPAFRARNIAVVLPDAASYFHLFRFPGSLTDAEARSALSFQIEEIVPLPAGDLVGAYAVASRGAEETAVFEAVALQGTVHAIELACERAGFSVAHVVLEAEAHAAALLGAERAGHATLVVDIGARSTVLVVRDELGLRGTFSKPFAGDAMTDALASATGLAREQAEALKRSAGIGPKADTAAKQALGAAIAQIAREMLRVIAWYRSVEPSRALDEVVLTGGSAELPGIAEEATAVLTAGGWKGTVRIGDPLVRLRESSATRDLARAGLRSLFAPAIGAAIAGFSPPAFEFHGAGGIRSLAPRRLGRVRHPVADVRQFFQYIPPHAKLVAAVLFVAAAFLLLGLVVFERFETSVTARSEDTEPVLELTQGTFVRVLTMSTDSSTGDIPARLVSVPDLAVSVTIVPTKTSGVLTQEDVDAALAQAKLEAADALAASAQASLTADEVLRTELSRATLRTHSVSAEIGKETDIAVVTAIFHLDALAYRQDDLLAALQTGAEDTLAAEVRALRVIEINPDFRFAVIRVLGRFSERE